MYHTLIDITIRELTAISIECDKPERSKFTRYLTRDSDASDLVQIARRLDDALNAFQVSLKSLLLPQYFDMHPYNIDFRSACHRTDRLRHRCKLRRCLTILTYFSGQTGIREKWAQGA
jgi:hypothetical protein